MDVAFEQRCTYLHIPFRVSIVWWGLVELLILPDKQKCTLAPLGAKASFGTVVVQSRLCTKAMLYSEVKQILKNYFILAIAMQGTLFMKIIFLFNSILILKGLSTYIAFWSLTPNQLSNSEDKWIYIREYMFAKSKWAVVIMIYMTK